MDMQQALIDRALKQLSDPAFPQLKVRRRLEKLLVGARETGDLSMLELHRAAKDLVDEADVPRYFAKSGDGSESDAGAGLALIFLLLLLMILAALAGEDSDLQALIQELIDDLLGR